MSLRSKIVLIVAAVALIYVAVDVAVLRTMVGEPFRVLEESEITKDGQRVEAGLDALVLDLAGRARAFGSRADVASLVADGAAREAFGAELLADLDLDLLYVCDGDGRVLWGRIEESGSDAPIDLREFPRGGLNAHHPLEIARREGLRPAGLMNTERGPMLVALAVLADSGGAPRGRILAGRFFDEAMRADLLARTQIAADVWSAEEPLPEGSEDLRDEVTASGVPVVEYVSDERVDVYTALDDVRGQPRLILRSTFDRSISHSGRRILDFAMLSTVATALLILLVLLRLLDRIVLRPLSQLTRHTAEIGRTEDMSKRVALDRGDEFGRLSAEFDGLMGKLQRSREQVIETARVAGMSEIATGILHNVGNVLNSVNVSTNLAKSKAERLAVADLRAMTDVLNANADDLARFVAEDPRGRQFLPFLGELTREMSSQRDDLLGELRALGQGVDHVIELVRNQQSYAGLSGVYEPTDLAEAIDAALAICRQAYTLPADLELRREIADLPRVAVDRHKLMEILVNLIQNAGQVMRDAETPDKRLVCRLDRDVDGQVKIEIEDNGPGIAPENLARIFSHGFTTRKGGHGFGLHVSANAATEMKGALHAESEGPGTGATFVLRLPFKTTSNEVASAA